MRRRSAAAAAAGGDGVGLMGSENPDSRCYAIACLAMFLMIPQGFAAKEPISPVIAALRALCRRRWRAGGGVATVADTDPILAVMPHRKRQEDAHEFLRRLTAHLEDQGGAAHLAKHTHGQITTVTTCSVCSAQSRVTESTVEFTIELGGVIRTMHDYFDRRFHQPTTLEHPNAWTGCPRCAGPVSATLRRYVETFPKYMTVLLSRFRGDGGAKDTTSVNFERTILVKDERPGGSIVRTYVLVSVIHHEGTLDHGHYTCFCRIKKTWWWFDDAKVTPVADTFPVHSGSTPYILLYRLAPMTEVDAAATAACAAAAGERAAKRPRFPDEK